MAHARSDVSRSLQSFLAQLPEKAQCQITLFDHNQYHLAPDGAAIGGYQTGATPKAALCSSFQNTATAQAIERIGGGGTDIVEALEPMYQSVLANKEALNLVLVISDGAGSAWRWSPAFRTLVDIRTRAVEEAGAYTVVNWLGNFATNYPLGDLADLSLPGPVEQQPFAQDFFRRANGILNSQSVVTPRTCS